MNLGAFACVIAVARRTRSAEITIVRRAGQDEPALAVLFSMFLFSLAGIPPLAGWFAKFVMFRAVFDAGTTSAVILGVIAAVISVVAFFYYAAVARQMWFHEPADLGEVDVHRCARRWRSTSRSRSPRRRGRGRRVPAALRPHRRPRLPARLTRMAPRDAHPGAHPPRGRRSRSRTFMEARALRARRRVLHPRRRRGPRRARLRHQSRGRLAVRHGDRPGARRRVAAHGRARPVRGGRGRRRAAAASRPTSLRAAPACAGALRYVLVERSASCASEQRERLTLEPPDEALGPFMRRRRRRVARARARASARSSPRSTSCPRVAHPRRGARQRAARQPARPRGRARARRRLARGPGRRRRRPASSEVSSRRRRRSRPRPTSSPRARSSTPARGSRSRARLARWLERVGAMLAPGRGRPRRLRRHRELARGAGQAVVAAHVPRAPARRRPARAPGHAGHHRATSRSSTSRRIADRVGLAARASTCRRPSGWADLGIDELVPRATRCGRRAPPAATSRRSPGRSRGVEAAALTDPGGLGAHRVARACAKRR